MKNKTKIHLDTRLDQLVNQSHSPDAGDDDMMMRYQGSNSIQIDI